MSRYLVFVPALAWTAVVAYLSLAEPGALPRWDFLQFRHADKLLHLFFYGIMYVLYHMAFHRSRMVVRVMAVSVFICGTIGFVMELLQWAMPHGRYFDMLDIMANITGAFIAAAFTKIQVLWARH